MAAQDLASQTAPQIAFDATVMLATALFAVATGGYVASGIAAWRGVADGSAWRRLAGLALVPSLLLLLHGHRPLPEVVFGLVGDLVVVVLATHGHFGGERDRVASTRPTVSTARARIDQVGIALAFGGLLLVIVARPWSRNWGSTKAEQQVWLPGDEHATDPRRAGNRAISIEAPAEDVWPWLLQLGLGRGGFYSYAALERICGLPIVNAERIVPEWQHLAVGDFVRAAPPTWFGGLFGDRVGWEVDHVDQDRKILALRYWIFEVETVDTRRSRLHVRSHAGDVPPPLAALLLLTFEPAHFVMEQAMLRGIRDRAERRPASGLVR